MTKVITPDDLFSSAFVTKQANLLHQILTHLSDKYFSPLYAMMESDTKTVSIWHNGSTTRRLENHNLSEFILSLHKQIPAFQLKNLILCLDYKVTSDFAIHHIKELQKAFHFTIHLVYVNTPFYYETSFIISYKIRTFIKMHQLKNYTIHIVEADTPDVEMSVFACQLDADLIIRYSVL